MRIDDSAPLDVIFTDVIALATPYRRVHRRGV